jgi:translation elongation factor TU
MFCPNCKNNVVDGAEFCPFCGTNLKHIQQHINQLQSNNYEQSTSTSNKKITFIVSILIVLVLIVFAVVGANKLLNKNNDSSNSIETTDNNVKITGTVEKDTNLTYDKNGAFLMTIESVYTITGRGTVATGTIERGTIKVNDEVQIIGLNHEIITTTVTAINKFRKTLDSAEIGANVSITLKDVLETDIEVGQVLAKPNSIKTVTKFDANVYIFTTDEGGRYTPFFNNFRPDFYFWSNDIAGTISLTDGVKTVMPGDTVDLTVELSSNVAMEVGTEFRVRENGRTIGKGTVTKLY